MREFSYASRIEFLKGTIIMMEEKEIIWQESFQADILAPNFCKQLKLEQSTLPPVEQSFYYNMDIQVPLAVMRQVEYIDAYPLPSSPRYCECEDKFGYILREQVRRIEDMFQTLGYQLKDTCICGELMDNPYEVTLMLWKGIPKENFANGALKPVYRTMVVIPSRSDFLNLLQRTLSKHYARMEEVAWDERDS